MTTGFAAREISCRQGRGVDRSNTIDGGDGADRNAAIDAGSGRARGGRASRAGKAKLNLRPLASLIPYVKRYRGRALAALGVSTAY
jgi:hypothetical protein